MPRLRISIASFSVHLDSLSVEGFGLDGVGGVEVSEGNRERVGSVGLWRLGKTENSPHHEGDLFFFSRAFAYNRLFDFGGGVFVDGETPVGGSDEGGGAGGSHGDGGAVGLHEDDALDSDFIGLPLLDLVGDSGADGGQRLGLGEALGDGDDVVSEGLLLIGIALDDGDIRCCGWRDR